MDELHRAVATMAEVRAKCVWTQQMTPEALLPYLIEESHELVDAVENGTDDDVVEELGDLLWQVLFHAQLAESEGRFTINDVARGLADKMIRRHPHVFAGEVAETPEQVLTLWNAAKAAEKKRESVLDGIAPSMPALALAQKVLGKAERVGVVAPLQPLACDTEADVAQGLLALVARARELGTDAETLLRHAVRDVEREVREAEAVQERQADDGTIGEWQA